MTKAARFIMTICSAGLLFPSSTRADNPIILDQFTADPTARVFDGKIYLYPSHDIPVPPGRGRANWFCMEDYHVFSSADLMEWQDHGVIVTQEKVDWVNAATYSMWAPDCVFRDGKYFFYFPAQPKPTGRAGPGGGASKIGVAIAEKPGGPYAVMDKPIDGVSGIDPCVLIDKDGQAYLYTSAGRISVAKLKDNMVELASPPQVIANLPTAGLIEGPFVFERNGNYYLTYPHVADKIERLEYAMGKSPTGPFTVTGVIMDESASGCWTNHHSLVEYQGQWYLFYHDRDLSPSFDKNRSVRADYLSFNEDGTINKVVPTFRGVGIADARRRIQIDRYSAVSKQGTAVSFLNDAIKSSGWKIALGASDAWVQYDRVDFGKTEPKSVKLAVKSPAGGTVEIRLDKLDGPVLAVVEIPKGSDWAVSNTKLAAAPTGIHNLVISMKENNPIELDWISFE